MADTHGDSTYAHSPAFAGGESSEANSTMTGPSGGGVGAAARGMAGSVTSRKKKLTVHQALGAGKFADVLLWRSLYTSGGILAGMTLVWAVFEFSGYTLLTLLSNTLLVLVAVLFAWANAAHILNRSPPPIPELELTEDVVQKIASEFRMLANKALALCHNVALGKEFKLFLKVLIGLYIVSMVGSWFSFLSLVYIVAILLFTIPKTYELYESDVDRVALIALEQTKRYYEMADKAVLSKIPKAPIREKKA